MTAKTPAQRQAAFYLRRIKSGWKQITIWVKADKVKALKEYAKGLK